MIGFCTKGKKTLCFCGDTFNFTTEYTCGTLRMLHVSNNIANYIILTFVVTVLACLAFPCALRCWGNGFTARLEFPFNMVITSGNQVRFTSLVAIVLPSCNNAIIIPEIPVGDQRNLFFFFFFFILIFLLNIFLMCINIIIHFSVIVR